MKNIYMVFGKEWKAGLMRKSIIGSSLVIFLTTPALAVDLAQSLNFDGQLLDSSNNPISSPVGLKFTILDPTGLCVLYEETHSSVTPGSDGEFSVKIGPGASGTNVTRNTSVDGGLPWKSIFQNDSLVRSPNSNNCINGYVPQAGHGRKLRVTVINGSSSTDLVPDFNLGSVPSATVAESLQGKTPSDFLPSSGNSVVNGSINFINQNELRFSATSPSIYVGFKAPPSLSTSRIWTLPSNDGTAGQVLQTDGSGLLSWITPPSTSNTSGASGVFAGSSGSSSTPSLQVGNTSSGLFSPANNSVALSTAGVERLRVDSSGKLGVGTATPVSALDVSFTSPNNSTDVRSYNGDSTGSARFVAGASGSSGSLSIEAHSSSPTTWSSTGTAAGDARARPSGSIFWSGNNPLNIAAAGGSNSYLRFYTNGDTSANERMRISANGNVGIGTTTPTYLLHVGPFAGTTQSAQFEGPVVIRNNSSGQPTNLTLTNLSGLSGSGASLDFVGLNSSTSLKNAGRISGYLTNQTSGVESGALVFHTVSAGALLEKMRIDGSGNVGIGTSAPSVSLDLGARSDAIRVPAGTSAQRPTSPANGDLRFNTATQQLEVYANAFWQSMGSASNVVDLTSSQSIYGTKWFGEQTTFSGVGPSPAVLVAGGGLESSTLKVTGSTSLMGNLNVNSGKFVVDAANAKVGIGSATTPYHLSFDGDGSRTIGMDRNSLPDISGNNLILRAGGASTSAFDKDGGNLILMSGIATGLGSSSIEFRTSTSGTSGSIDNQPTAKMTITGSGNVGIGTLSPTEKLTVSGVVHSTSGGFKFPDGTVQTSAATGTPSIAANTTGNIATLGVGASGSGVGHVAIGYNAGNGYTGNQSVLIGYSTASAGGSGVYNTAVGSNANSGTPLSGSHNTLLGSSTFVGSTVSNAIAIGKGATVSGNGGVAIGVGATAPAETVVIGTSNGSFQERLRIDSSGNVGIGTATPAVKLDVNGAIAATSSLPGTTGINSKMLPVQGSYLSWNDSNGDGETNFNNHRGVGVGGFKFNLFATNGGYMDTPVVITGMGKVGIGTMTPLHRLDLIGGDLNIGSGGVIRFNGSQICSSTGCTSLSDKRLKEDIQPLDGSLEKILRLEGVTYSWKDKEKHGRQRQIGFVAQEVEEVYPQVVVTDPKTGTKSIAYDHLIAPLIEAVKELHASITELFSTSTEHSREIASIKEENEQLKQENAEIKARLERIEALLQAK